MIIAWRISHWVDTYVGRGKMDDKTRQAARLWTLAQPVVSAFVTSVVRDFAARDDAPGPTEKTTPGYEALDLSAGYRFPFGIDVRVILRNLFDKRYPATSDAVAVNAPGRGVSVVVGGSF